MSAIIAFIVRLVGYALLVGAPARIGEYYWERGGLDQAQVLQSGHALAITIVIVTPIVLAFFGFGRLRPVAVFIAMYLGFAALTAPFALARLAPAG